MPLVLAHQGKFLDVLWDENSRVISIDWKQATAAMTDQEFKADLTLIAGHVEERKARGLLVIVANFHHTPGPGLQEWRVKHISSRYNAAGLRRMAFLFPQGSQAPAMNESTEGENFLTKAFATKEEALKWLAG